MEPKHRSGVELQTSETSSKKLVEEVIRYSTSAKYNYIKMGMLWQHLCTSLFTSESTGCLTSQQLFKLTATADLIIYIQYTKEDNVS